MLLDNSQTVSIEDLITVAEAARRIRRKEKTLHNWISKGLLGGAQGLYYIGPRRPMIHWPTFQKAFVRKAS